ncbi:MAG: SDR family oxidoreductase [Cellvibrionaceae bacterium]|nr:SDR family oxidoreductase [Cellvibrionaceae bacterium]
MSNNEKWVLVTGASRGIGKSCAEKLLEEGFSVLAGVRSNASLEAIASLNNPRYQPIKLDICEENDLAALVPRLEALELYAVVNNAGSAVLGPIEFLPLKELKAQFDINLFAQVAVIQAALPMLRKNQGRIVNISSISGFIGFPYFGAYSSSKFALEGLSESLSRELGPQGVAVALVQPGNMDTDIWQRSHDTGKKLEDAFPDAAAQIYGKRFASSSSFGFLKKSSPQCVADAVLLALTDKTPQFRYLAGRDAQRYALIKKIVPERFLKRFI